MYNKSDFDMAIDFAVTLKTYVENVSLSLNKPSKDIIEAVDFIGCALTEAKERLFGKDCAICDGIIEVEDAKNSERGYNNLCLQHQKECFEK